MAKLFMMKFIAEEKNNNEIRLLPTTAEVISLVKTTSSCPAVNSRYLHHILNFQLVSDDI